MHSDAFMDRPPGHTSGCSTGCDWHCLPMDRQLPKAVCGRDGLLDYGDLDIPVFEEIRDPSTKVLNIEAWKEISRQTAKKLLLIQKERVLALLKHLDRLWFHLDVDVLDPTIMPVCFPESDGLSIDEALSFISTSIRSKKFMGMSVACYHPNLDLELKASEKVVGMLGSALFSCT